MSELAAISIRRTLVDQIIDLRHAILRAGLPRETAMFPGDEATTSRHYAALAAGRVVGCATLHLNQWQGEPAWQLRGMATAPQYRAKGLGTAILKAIEDEILIDPQATRLLWCNARVPAAGFYTKLGWTIASEQFEVPTAGPHYRMWKRIARIP